MLRALGSPAEGGERGQQSRLLQAGLVEALRAARQIPLPEDPPWWELHNVSFEELAEVCCEVHALYARPPAAYVRVGREPGALSAGALPTPMASPATAHGTPAASRQEAGSGGGLQNGGESAHAGGGAAGPGSGDDRDGAPAQVRGRRCALCERGMGWLCGEARRARAAG